MICALAIVSLITLTVAGPASSPAAVSLMARAPQEQVVDRIVARIEDDIITLSQVHELAAYQLLIDGRSEANDRLLGELIEQWVVNTEATEARFPAPAESEVNREVARIEDTFPSPQAYSQRIAVLGLRPEDVRRIVAREIYLARYLDYKFRPSVQVDDSAVAKYYQEQFAPALTAKGQKAPPLDTVTDQIHELLIQQDISSRAAAWFTETKSRLKITIEPATEAPPAGNS